METGKMVNVDEVLVASITGTLATVHPRRDLTLADTLIEIQNISPARVEPTADSSKPHNKRRETKRYNRLGNYDPNDQPGNSLNFYA